MWAVIYLLLFLLMLWGAVDADRHGKRGWQIAFLVMAALNAVWFFQAVFG